LRQRESHWAHSDALREQASQIDGAVSDVVGLSCVDSTFVGDRVGQTSHSGVLNIDLEIDGVVNGGWTVAESGHDFNLVNADLRDVVGRHSESGAVKGN